MRTIAIAAICLSLPLVAGSCGTHRPPQSMSSGSIRPLPLESGPDVMGHLEHRNGTVTVKVSAEGTTLYSGKNKEGKILFENMTAEQLRVHSPQTYDFLQAYEKAGASDLQ